MLFNQGQGPLPNIIANMDELQGMSPELAQAIRHQEESQIRDANTAIRSMTPEQIVARLKGVLWRIVPLLRLSEMIQMDYGCEVLSVQLRTALTTISDAVKWIGWNNGIDPLAAFGDDTVVVCLRDMTLGQGPGAAGHVEDDSLDTGTDTGENHHDDDEDI